MTVKDDVLNSRNLISIKERIRQLEMNSSNLEHITYKKTKTLPKPIVSVIPKANDNPLVTKLRGKLNKSYSTPAYDFSANDNVDKDFKFFDSDLRMSVEDKRSYGKKDDTSLCAVNEDKIKSPDKPVLASPKFTPSKNDDDTSRANLIELKSVDYTAQSVKSVLYFPKHPSSKAEGIDEDTDVMHNIVNEPQYSKSIKKSGSRVLESASRFSFDTKHEEHLESMGKSYPKNQNGNLLKYDSPTTYLSQDFKVPMSTDPFKYSLSHIKSKSYSYPKMHYSNVGKNSFYDLSDVCSPISLTAFSGSDEVFQVNTKDNISLSSEQSDVASHYKLLNASATFPRQKTEAKRSQPPIPAPRLSKLTGWSKTSYQNMLDTTGKDDNKGQAQLFQRNPLIASKYY